MTVKIITDSLGDLPAELVKELGITIIPLTVHFGDEVYRDGVDIDTARFYEKLLKSRVAPTTRISSLGVYVQTFDKLAEETDQILVITNSQKMSASYEAMVEAVDEMTRSCRVEVIDSQWAVMAQGLIVLAAARAAKEGAGLDELVSLTRKNIPRADIRMAFDTLQYLEEGGRIGKARAFLGSKLKVTPILGIREGEAFPFSREHSRARAIDHLYYFATSFSHIEEMAVEDATTSREADALTKRLKTQFPKTTIHRTVVSPVIGAHVGPRVIGVAVLGDRG
ncbi:MAG: DegV family protein [Dehalococcoidia bacterium]|jgi:DegV family protein with EDD domain